MPFEISLLFSTNFKHQQLLVGETLTAPASTNIRRSVQSIQIAQSILRGQPGCVKVGTEPGRWLLMRFHFPEIARQRYTALFAEIEARTGWQVLVQEGIHQEALAAMARSVLPQGLTPAGTPSIYSNRQAVLLPYKGTASQEAIATAQEQFATETGWQLTLVKKDNS